MTIKKLRKSQLRHMIDYSQDVLVGLHSQLSQKDIDDLERLLVGFQSELIEAVCNEITNSIDIKSIEDKIKEIKNG